MACVSPTGEVGPQPVASFQPSAPGGIVIAYDALGRPATSLPSPESASARIYDLRLMSRIVDGGLHTQESHHTLASLQRRLVNADPNVGDGKVLLALFEALSQQIHALGLEATFDMEARLTPVLIRARDAGIRVDGERWRRLVANRDKRARALRKRLEVELDIGNVHADAQVLEGLRDLGIDSVATSAEKLAQWFHLPVVRRLVEYRQLHSFVAGVGRGVLAALEREPQGRVRAVWRQLASPTGRMSTASPNLMGMPNDADVRSCIVPDDGNVFLVLDYQNAELRVLAEVTGDAALVDAFIHGRDPHVLTASRILAGGGAVDRVLRQRAKAFNFGLPLGMGTARFVAYALKNFRVTFSMDQAAAFKKRFFENYEGVRRWQMSMKDHMPLEVRTVGGRLRRFPNRTDGYTKRLAMEVQGTAADAMKRALLQLSPVLGGFDAKLVLAIHDEVIIECASGAAHELMGVAEACLEAGMSAYVKRVPVQVTKSIATSWAKEVSS